MPPEIVDQANDLVRERVTELVKYVEAGRVFEAIREFYSDAVAMDSGTQPPMFGLAAQTPRNKLLADVTEWSGFRIKGLGVNGDTSFVECALDFESADGSRVSMDQVAVATWRDGKIVRERFLPRTVHD